MQTKLQLADLEMVLALTRGNSLAGAAKRLHVDSSTVFRAIKRIEQQLGAAAFTRTRAGYEPTELGAVLARHAETIETELEAARAAAACERRGLDGTVRITSTDLVMNHLVMPALTALSGQHPRLELDLVASNELANLSKRDADIAVRATRKPPEHLVGKKLGQLHYGLYIGRTLHNKLAATPNLESLPWVAPDAFLPEHPSINWRHKHFPSAQAMYRVDSVLSMLHAVACGLGVGVLPNFLAKQHDLIPLSEPLSDCVSELWLLTHPDIRHIHRIKAVFNTLAEQIRFN